MGQQQLLLLVLSTVIVGLATVAGIQAFEQGSKRANLDALTQTGVKIASDMQAQAKKPTQFGGLGLDSFSDASKGDKVTLQDMGYSTSSNGDYASGNYYDTADGECWLSDGDANSNSKFEVTCESGDSKAVVEVTDLGSSDGITSTTQSIK